jgi:uncharacterized membrane protein
MTNEGTQDILNEEGSGEQKSLTPIENVSSFERGLSLGFGVLLIYSGVQNFRHSPFKSILRTAIGSGLIFQGASGHSPLYHRFGIDGTKRRSVNVRTSFTVNKPRNEVYSAWRNLGTLPRFMNHLSNVSEVNGTTSHWEARIPENSPVTISWDAEIVKDEPGQLLSWRSLPGSTIENAGKVEFRDALGHHGTEIRVIISYRPPAGNIGGGVAKLLNPLFRKLIKKDVLNFKQYIEFQRTDVGDGFR